MALIRVQDLNVHLGESHVLQGVSFEVPEGGVTALLGRNGVGKTTTLRAMMGLVPRRGTVSLAGEEGKLFHPLAFTKTFAMVGSTLLAVTIVPVLCSWLVRGPFHSEDRNIVMKCLEANPEDRYQDASFLVHDLETTLYAEK